MCRIDYCDERVEELSHTQPKARKPHKCGECYREIEPGEHYDRISGVFDGSVRTYKTCLQCCVVRDWLNAVCGGWVYSEIREDIQEHFDEGYGLWCGRASVWMGRKWLRRNGELQPPLKMPEQLPVGH